MDERRHARYTNSKFVKEFPPPSENIPLNTKPDYPDVLAAIQAFQSQGGTRIVVHEIGKSLQGRAIPAVTLTDPALPAAEKQHLLVYAGQHGSEESGRAIALALIEFLLSNEPLAAETLRKMIVVVIPCMNPDSTVYRNAAGVDIAHTFKRGQPAGTPEGQALEAFALKFVPDFCLDIHGLAGGSMKDRVWLIPPLPFGPDAFFLTEIGRRMTEAAEADGFPQLETVPPGNFRGNEENLCLLGDKLAGEYKTLCLGMETIEDYYREEEWRADGMARLRALLKIGLEDTFGLGEPGFPTTLVSGSRVIGLKACGATVAERRENRVALTRFLRDNFAMVERGADGADGCAKVSVSSKTVNGENPGRFALILRLKKPCTLQAVEWDGQPLNAGAAHGYRVWENENSLLVQANLHTPFGGSERRLIVRYQSPHLEQ